MSFPDMIKYPRTPHLEDSRLQIGDEDCEVLRLQDLQKLGELAVEEKLDAANSGFRFDAAGTMMAQSRGHYLDMGDIHHPRERDFSLFKQWLKAQEDIFLERFEDRYVVYGEWMAIAHTVYYDRLPHLFMEFDILDLQSGKMLSTTARRRLLDGLPIMSVPVLHRGPLASVTALKSLVRASLFKTPKSQGNWSDNLRRSCALVHDDFESRWPKMDQSDFSEGLYIKVERDDEVVMRAKWVRPDFVQTILASNEHWQSRFPVPNLMDGQISIFPPHLSAGDILHQADYDPDNPLAWIG